MVALSLLGHSPGRDAAHMVGGLAMAECQMNCLWITLADPEPATNGQLIYSEGLIRAAREAGAALTVIGLARTEKPNLPADRPGLAWRLAGETHRPAWRRVLRAMPAAAQRGLSPVMDRMLAAALAERVWDAIVFDSICAAWALPAVLRYQAKRNPSARLVYLSHNHETTVARRIASVARGARRLYRAWDALRLVRLERRLMARCDLVTSNTPDDTRTFTAEAAPTPVILLPPGYGGHRVAARTIDAAMPRRAIIAGSFDWPPKRISLERFLAGAVPILTAARIELQLVGETEPAYLVSLRQRFPAVRFEGRVDDVRPYLAGARLALVPDELGGFKLKGLDYVFNRLPVLAMRAALPGMPLEDGVSVGLFDSHRDLAEGVVALIDDFATLNRRQREAYDACAMRFDWPRIGRHLVDTIRSLERPWERASAPARAAAAPSSMPSIPVPPAAGR
jgi:glycosyltransferase involved in cell wall biosynthesis